MIPPIHSLLGKLAAWLERPFLRYPHVELVLVMVCAPILVNAFSVIIFDNLMKRKKLAPRDATPPLGTSTICASSGSLSDSLIATPMRI
jgi:hypothetical protein